MEEEWWTSVPKRSCVRGIHTLRTRVCVYTRVASGKERVEVESMIDLVLVKKDMLRYVQDGEAVGGMGRGLSDPLVVLWGHGLGEER